MTDDPVELDEHRGILLTTPGSGLPDDQDRSARPVRVNTAQPRGSRFAHDSPLEEAVTSELVSKVRFPVTRENTANHVRRRGAAPVEL
jgi:hypothetical protein